MPAVRLPLQLRQREIYGIQPLLFANLNRMIILISINDEEHAVEITNILLWIAQNYPEALEDKSNILKCMEPIGSFKCLNFRSSWEFTDVIVPTDSLQLLLRSHYCRFLEAFCGYVNQNILISLPWPICVLRIAIGKHSDVSSVIKQLHIRYSQAQFTHAREKLSIHIKCGELDLEVFSPLPSIYPTLYISDVDDENTSWVVQATVALAPFNAEKREEFEFEDNSRCSNSGIEILRLPRSKLTKNGVEAIVKGLCDINLSIAALYIASPYFTEKYRLLCDNENNMSFYFSKIFQDEFNYGYVGFCDEKDLFFTEFNYKNILSVGDFVSSDTEDNSTSSDNYYSESDH